MKRAAPTSDCWCRAVPVAAWALYDTALVCGTPALLSADRPAACPLTSPPTARAEDGASSEDTNKKCLRAGGEEIGGQ